MRVLSILAAMAAAGMILASTALAVPYASGVSVAGNDVAFTLNEDAQNVTVMLDGGGTVDLGAMTKGTHNINVPNFGSHQIKVTNSAAAGWTQTSANDMLTSFYAPSGVAVNRNPTSPNYGSVYVSNAASGTAVFGRNTPEGIYRLAADLNPVNNGTAGVVWGGSSGPWKCVVGQDDNLYAADLSNDLAFELAPDLSANVQLVAAGNRTANQWVASIHVTGTKAAGNRKIYLTNSNYNDTARRGIIEYDLGAADAVAAGDTGTQVIGPSYFNYYPQDAIRDSAGNWYTGQYRSVPTQGAAIAKFAPGDMTTPVWETPKAAPYNGSFAIDVYEPNGWVAYGNYYDGFVHVFDTDDGSYVGGFDAGSRMRDISFDAAGNIYTVDNLSEWLKVWSPGGDTMMSTPFAVVPEPATLVFLAAGGLVLARRRRS